MQSEEKRRLEEILETYADIHPPLEKTFLFIKAWLNPQPGEPYWTYRYEHSLRAARWGKQIAEGEGWNAEPLIMACLLHDVGYPLCRTAEDFGRHAAIGAQVAAVFLERIRYDAESSKQICRAIALHDRWNDLPEDASAFELSVRDADDLDRFDAARLCLTSAKDIGERSAGELIAVCGRRLTELSNWETRICGTQTARAFWTGMLGMRRQFYENIIRQMQGTLDMERILDCAM